MHGSPEPERLAGGSGPPDFWAIPFEDKYVLYRPLARVAFVANRALVEQLLRGGGDHSPAAVEAMRFVQSLGFLAPAPAPGPPPAGEGHGPTVACLCLTTACNLRCVYCYADGGERPLRELPFDLGKRAIDVCSSNASATGRRSFQVAFHGGGEPTVAWESLLRLTAYARDAALPCRVTLASNGCWSAEQRAWILGHVDYVSLSFDGLEAVQDLQRPTRDGAPSYAGVRASIRALDDAHVDYGIRMTATDACVASLPEAVARICAETTCSTIQVEPAAAFGRARRDGRSLTDHARFGQALLAAYDVARSAGRHLYYSGARPWLATTRFCTAIDDALIVTPTGEISACYEICDRAHPLAGSFLLGLLPAQAGWTPQSAARSLLLARIAQRRALCTGCFCYWHCAGDCPSKSHSSEGDGHLRFGPRCELNRQVTLGLLLRYMSDGGGAWKAPGSGACDGAQTSTW